LLERFRKTPIQAMNAPAGMLDLVELALEAAGFLWLSLLTYSNCIAALGLSHTAADYLLS
jgi:hypothetical protein